MSPFVTARTWRQGILNLSDQSHVQSYLCSSAAAPHLRLTRLLRNESSWGYTMCPPPPVGLTERLSQNIEAQKDGTRGNLSRGHSNFKLYGYGTR